jgi:hypothetical protein
MNDALYGVFETQFRAAAIPLVEQLRQRLTDLGLGPFTPVDIVDRDVERGLGFASVLDPGIEFFDLMLHDGDEYGYEGVSLAGYCSIYGSGQVWAPANYTSAVGIVDASELARRLADMDLQAMASDISAEWSRVRLTQVHAQHE